MSGKYEDLEKLKDLLDKGILSETEFITEKEKIFGKEVNGNENYSTNFYEGQQQFLCSDASLPICQLSVTSGGTVSSNSDVAHPTK